MIKQQKPLEAGSSAGSSLPMPLYLDWESFIPEPGFAAVADANSKLCSGLIALNKEWVDFLARRLQADLSLAQKFGACKTPQDLLQVYSDFYRQAFDDYQREFAKLALMGQGLAAEAGKVMRVQGIQAK